MTATVILFGGAGFIGHHLCLHLINDGEIDQIIIADIKKPTIQHKKIKYHYVDVTEEIELENYFGIVTAYNLAATHKTPGHDAKEYYSTNILGSLNINKFCEAHNIRNLVFTSTMSVYRTNSSANSETSKTAPTNDYGNSKIMAEEIHKRWSEASNVNLVICRPAVIFGYREGANFTRLLKLCQLGIFVFPGTGNTIKSCYYVKHLIRDIQYALSLNEKYICFNASYEGEVTLADIKNGFRHALQTKFKSVYIPATVLKVLSYILKKIDLFGLGIHPERVNKLLTNTNIEPAWLKKHGKSVHKRNLGADIRGWLSEVDLND